MTGTDLAAAVRAAVDDWMQSTPIHQRKVDLVSPATLGAILGLAIEESLEAAGFTPSLVRGRVQQEPYCHLEAVFEVTSLVDTPIEFNPVPDTAATMAGRAAAIAVHGFLALETISYGSENEGNLFVNLVSLPGEGALPEKSKKSMRGHTDGVSFPFNGEDDDSDARIAPSPDIVTLVGLRNPNWVPTMLMPLDAIMEHLTPGDIAELRKPQYSMRSQKTFVQGMRRILGHEHVVANGAILKDVQSGTFVRYSHSSVTPPKDGGSAEQATRKLELACSRATIPVVVHPGDVLVVNNRRSLHGRGEVGEAVGGQSRWLLRTYGLDTSNLAQCKRHPGNSPSHILFP
jgi:hypothetical protein